MSETPLSSLVAQGWEIVGYDASDISGEQYQHSFVLRKAGRHKVLTVRKKMIGEGLVTAELDL